VRFECDFADPDDRSQHVTLKVQLTEDEIKAIRVLRSEDDPHLWTKIQAYALKHAYAQAPDGFRHISGGIRQVMVN
jgi:hypothetical protein